MRLISWLRVAVLLNVCMLSAGGYVCAATDMEKLLLESGWKPKERANCLFVGPESLPAAMEAGKLPGIRAYLVVDKQAVRQARQEADAAGLYGTAVIVREGSLQDTSFPDYFFHRVVVLGDVSEENADELWRVTRPGGQLLLGAKVQGLKFKEAPGVKVGSSAWQAVTRPVLGSEWPMEGGYFYKDTLMPANASPDPLIRPPLKLLWMTRLPGPITQDACRRWGAGQWIIAGGKVYVSALGVALDAYTGEILDGLSAKLPGGVPYSLTGRMGVVGAWKQMVFIAKDRGVVALDSETLEEKWTAKPGLSPLKNNMKANGYLGVGVEDGCVLFEDPQKEKKEGMRYVVYCDAFTGKMVKEGYRAVGERLKGVRYAIAGAIAPDGTDYFVKHAPDGLYSSAQENGEWLKVQGWHGCSAPTVAGGYLWWLREMEGLCAYKLGLPGAEAVKTRWAFAGPCMSCFGAAVAYGNLYTADRGPFFYCFASGKPYPEQAGKAPEPVLEKGEAPPDGSREANGSDWPMLEGDPARTGSSPAKVEPPTKVLWTSGAAPAARTAPVVAGGLIFTGSSDQRLYALDAATGAKRWSYLTEDEVQCTPCVSGAMVSFGSDDGWIYCLNAATGKLVWRRSVDRRAMELEAYKEADYCFARLSMDGVPKRGPWVVEGSPLVVEGRLYIATGAGEITGEQWGFLYCLDARSGELIWKQEMFGFSFAPAYMNGKICALWGKRREGEFRVFDAKTGKLEIRTKSHLPNEAKPEAPHVNMFTPFALAGGRAFVHVLPYYPVWARACSIGLTDGAIFGVGDLDLARQTETHGRIPLFHPVIGDGMAYFFGRYGIAEGRIYGYSVTATAVPGGGKDKNLPTHLPCALQTDLKDKQLTASPVYAGGLLFCPVSGRGDKPPWGLVTLEAKTGEPKAFVQLGERVDVSPAVAGGKLFVVTRDGKVHCLGGP